MPEFCRQYKYCLKNIAQDFTVCLTANFYIQANCILILCLCACVCARVCVCVCACMCVCVRERGGGELCGTELNVTCSHEMSLNLKFGNWRYVHVSNLQVLLVILILTTVARKRSRSFCQKCRWLVTANTHTPYVCDCMKCMGYTKRTEMAAVSCGTSRTSAVST